MITQCNTTSYKVDLLNAVHNFSTDTFKLALYYGTATLDDTTTAYTTSGEITGTGYTAGGVTVTATAPTSSNKVAYVDFSDAVWAGSTFTAVRGALLYNASKSNKAVAVLDFGADKSTVNQPFTVQFPVATDALAIVRVS